MLFSSCTICSSAAAEIFSSSCWSTRTPAASMRASTPRKRQIDFLVELDQPQRFDLLRRIGASRSRKSARSPGAPESVWFRCRSTTSAKRVIRRRRPDQEGIERRRVANPAHRFVAALRIGRGEQLEQLRIVHHFRPLLVGQPFAHRRERFVVGVVCRDPRRSRLRGSLDRQHARPESFVVRLFRIEREPNRRLLSRAEPIRGIFAAQPENRAPHNRSAACRPRSRFP